MPRLKANNLVETELAEDITETADTIEVVDSSVFPEPPFRATIDARDEIEIVEVNDVSGNTLLDVERGLEHTDAFAFDEGTDIEQRFTAGMYSKLADIIGEDLEPKSVKVEEVSQVSQVVPEGSLYIIDELYSMTIAGRYQVDGEIEIEGDLAII